MSTRHLLNCLKFIHFNSDPAAFKGMKFKKWPSVQDWDVNYRKRAKAEFLKELRKRPDFNEKDLFAILL